jgi:glycerophosphoryl diester phosphodiesterase
MEIQMLRISHRGYHVHAIENTLEAFAAAVELGVDGIETDIRLSSDRVPILYHDRLIDNEFPVESLTHREICRRLKYEVPTVASALDQFSDIIWNLEVKVANRLEIIIAELSQYIAKRQILITSFFHDVVEHICATLDIEGGLLVCHRPCNCVNPEDWIPNRRNITTLVWDWETSDRQVLADVAKRGVKNFVYGAVTDLELSQLVQWGVDGIIADHPERIKFSHGGTLK